MTFVHQFNRRVRVTVTVTDEMPAKGKTHIVNCEWTEFPKPLPKFMREYVRWICEVNRICADKWNEPIAHAVQVGPRTWELWHFEPGRAPVLVEVLRS
jgi:hypothetical protein